MTVSRNDDPYIDAASGVLRNELDITDAEKLEHAEGAYSAARSYQLQETQLEGNFDLKHLQAIHKHLFQDVYAWAGKIRTVDISKGREKFARPMFIEKAGASIFSELAKENRLIGLKPSDFSDRAAHYMNEINILHPFREGNSRALREFISHVAKQSDYYVAWERVSHEETQRGTLAAFHGDTSQLSSLIGQNLHTINHREPAVEQVAEASESYYAKLSALAESRGADVDRGVGDGFDLDR